MRKVKEILRLKWGLGLGVRQVAGSCSVSHSTVIEVLARAEAVGLSWPLPEDLDETALEAKLYPPPSQAKEAKPMPGMEYINKELRRKGVTLQLLWEEHKQAHPDAYQRSQFCQAYRDWAKTIDVSVRQIHLAGEKMFVDYAGQKVPVIEPPARPVRPWSSSRSSAPATTPTPSPAGVTPWSHGSAPTSGRSSSLAGCRRCWYQTTSSPG